MLRDAAAAPPLPPLKRSGLFYLGLLLLLAGVFYVLLLASLAGVGFGLYELAIFTPMFLDHMRGTLAVKLLLVAYGSIALFGIAILRGIFARTGGDPPGLPLTRANYPRVFALTDGVAKRVSARPIDDVFITPEDEIGVWEETALYMPPGFGKRKLVIGMGALNYLSLEQLKSVLAHEYGHFSNKDTFFSRFIYRVLVSFSEIIDILGSSMIQRFNPLFWMLYGYVWFYSLLASGLSRRNEFAADRFAVEAFGGDSFRQAIIASHVEGSFFNEAGMKGAFDLAMEGREFKNIYRVVSFQRWSLQTADPRNVQRAAHAFLKRGTGAYDSHPSLRERLEAQGQLATILDLPPPPRPVPCEKQPEDPMFSSVHPDAVPSAAEVLFQDRTVEVQRVLSNMISERFHLFAQAYAKASDRALLQ